MVQNDLNRHHPAAINQISSKMGSRNAHAKQHHTDTRRGLFSRVYGGSKAVVQAKVAEVINEISDGESYDYDDIAVDALGLPLSSSDLHSAVQAANFRDPASLQTEEEKREAEEQDHALALFHHAVQVISSLPFQYEQSDHLYSKKTQDMGRIPLRETRGPTTLEELMVLRLAVTNISAAFIHADPSPRGRLARKNTLTIASTSTAPEPAEFRIESLKRMPVPDYDEVDSIKAPSTLSSPGEEEDVEEFSEHREELASTFDSPLLHTIRPPKLRGVYQARALRKLEVEKISSDESSEEDNGGIRIADYYIAKHRASRKNEVKHVVSRNSRRSKAYRRTTTILDSKDEMKSYLLKSGGTANYQLRSKVDFISGLDEAHRRTTAPPVPTIQPHFISGSSVGVLGSSSSSSEGGDSPKMNLSTSALSFDSANEGASTPPTSDVNCSPASFTSTLSTSPSSQTSSSLFISSDEDRGSPKPKANRSYSDVQLTKSSFQPARPKRHPGRGKSSPGLDRMQQSGSNERFKQMPPSPMLTEGHGFVMHYSKLESSSDVTPRPGALGFNPGLFQKEEYD